MAGAREATSAPTAKQSDSEGTRLRGVRESSQADPLARICATRDPMAINSGGGPNLGLAAIDDPKLVDSELKPPFYSYRIIKIRGPARGPSIGAESGHGVIRPFAAHDQVDQVEY